MNRSVLLALVSFVALSRSVLLRGNKLSRRLPLWDDYCAYEAENCENDEVCSECLSGAVFADVPDVDDEDFDCDALNEWFYSISFEDPETCDINYGGALITLYAYCLYDSFRVASGMGDCKPVFTDEATTVPTTNATTPVSTSAPTTNMTTPVSTTVPTVNITTPVPTEQSTMTSTPTATPTSTPTATTTMTVAPTLVYCNQESTNCLNNAECAACLATGVIPEAPDVEDKDFDCDVLNEWYNQISLNDTEICNLDNGGSLVTFYVYCLYDSYRLASGIGECETNYTDAPTTAAPTTLLPTESTMTATVSPSPEE